jgi:hypothetical protein
MAVLLAAAVFGPGSPAAGAPELNSSSPTPGWATQLMSAYADACDATLDPAQVDGLSQSQAEAQVSRLIEACGTAATTTNGGGGGGGGKGSDKGKGSGKH